MFSISNPYPFPTFSYHTPNCVTHHHTSLRNRGARRITNPSPAPTRKEGEKQRDCRPQSRGNWTSWRPGCSLDRLLTASAPQCPWLPRLNLPTEIEPSQAAPKTQLPPESFPFLRRRSKCLRRPPQSPWTSARRQRSPPTCRSPAPTPAATARNRTALRSTALRRRRPRLLPPRPLRRRQRLRQTRAPPSSRRPRTPIPCPPPPPPLRPPSTSRRSSRLPSFTNSTSESTPSLGTAPA